MNPVRSAFALGILLAITALLLCARSTPDPSPDPEHSAQPAVTPAPRASARAGDARADRLDAAGLEAVRAAAAAKAAGGSRDDREPDQLARDESPHDDERSPEDRAFEEAYGEPTPELIREAFEQTLSETFVDERLSSDEIARASSALVRLREARSRLRELPMNEESARQRRDLIEEMNEATRDFTDVMEMDPAEFTEAARRGGGGAGIDRDEDDDYVPDDDYLERRR